jgi:hypothetical protein
MWLSLSFAVGSLIALISKSHISIHQSLAVCFHFAKNSLCDILQRSVASSSGNYTARVYAASKSQTLSNPYPFQSFCDGYGITVRLGGQEAQWGVGERRSSTCKSKLFLRSSLATIQLWR